jgi:hypothetical protein
MSYKIVTKNGPACPHCGRPMEVRTGLGLLFPDEKWNFCKQQYCQKMSQGRTREAMAIRQRQEELRLRRKQQRQLRQKAMPALTKRHRLRVRERITDEVAKRGSKLPD